MSEPGPARLVLIVDDEREIRELVASFAARLIPGAEVVTAGSATEAQAIVESRHVDAILTDLRMPGPSGIELLQAVRRTSTHTRRALMTGFHEDVIDGVPLDSLGLTGLLRKPFTSSDLRALLSKLGAPA